MAVLVYFLCPSFNGTFFHPDVKNLWVDGFKVPWQFQPFVVLPGWYLSLCHFDTTPKYYNVLTLEELPFSSRVKFPQYFKTLPSEEADIKQTISATGRDKLYFFEQKVLSLLEGMMKSSIVYFQSTYSPNSVIGR